VKIGSLFSGCGGLDYGLELSGLGEIVWHAEHNRAASTVLKARWPSVPNIEDVTQINFSKAPPVDVLCGGFPCQPWSPAGRQRGVVDPRWLWPSFATAIETLHPSLVVIENVPQLLSVSDGAGYEAILLDLDRLGYCATWSMIAASDIGAPHRRRRLFILAIDQAIEVSDRHPFAVRNGEHFEPASPTIFSAQRIITWPLAGTLSNGVVYGQTARPTEVDLPPLLPTPISSDARRSTASPAAHERGLYTLWETLHLLPTPDASNPNDSKEIENWLAGREQQREPRINDSGIGVPRGVAVRLLPMPLRSDASCPEHRQKEGTQALRQLALPLPGPAQSIERDSVTHTTARFGEYTPAIARWEEVAGRKAPAPLDDSGRLNPAFVEWMLGYPPGFVTRADFAGKLSRNEKIHVLGNSVQVQVAELVGHRAQALLTSHSSASPDLGATVGV